MFSFFAPASVGSLLCEIGGVAEEALGGPGECLWRTGGQFKQDPLLQKKKKKKKNERHTMSRVQGLQSWRGTRSGKIVDELDESWPGGVASPICRICFSTVESSMGRQAGGRGWREVNKGRLH